MISSLNSMAEYGVAKPLMIDANGICSFGRGAFFFQCSMRFVVVSAILDCLGRVEMLFCSRSRSYYISTDPPRVAAYPHHASNTFLTRLPDMRSCDYTGPERSVDHHSGLAATAAVGRPELHLHSCLNRSQYGSRHLPLLRKPAARPHSSSLRFIRLHLPHNRCPLTTAVSRKFHGPFSLQIVILPLHRNPSVIISVPHTFFTQHWTPATIYNPLYP